MTTTLFAVAVDAVPVTQQVSISTILVGVLARFVGGFGFLFALGFVAYAYRGPGDVVLGD